MDNRIGWRALTSGSATFRLINMDGNKLRKHIVRMMIIGFLLLLLPMAGIAAEQSKLPEWILDTIILPVPNNNTEIIFNLFKDKKGEIVFYYDIVGSGHPGRLVDLTTHQQVDPSTLELFAKPKTNSMGAILDSLERINYDFLDFKLNNTGYKIRDGLFSSGGNCDSPLGRYFSFYKQEKEIDSYLFLLSSSNKFKFKTNGFCSGMNGKETIKVQNLGLFPLFWVIDDNRILLGDWRRPFFIVIDAKKIDLALSETKTMIFDHAGVKGYWVKKSVIVECMKKAREELTGKGYDIYSEKPLKGNKSVNEYIDQAITDELNKSN